MGHLQYRVYLPAGGDFSKLTPPALTLEQGGRTESLGACATSTSLPTAPRPAPSAGQTATPATPTPAPQRAIPQLTFF